MGSKGGKKRRKNVGRSVAGIVTMDEKELHEEWWNETYIKEFAKLARKRLNFDQDFGFKVAMLIAAKAEPLKINPEDCAKLALLLCDDFQMMRNAGAKQALEILKGKAPVDESAETKHGDEDAA